MGFFDNLNKNSDNNSDSHGRCGFLVWKQTKRFVFSFGDIEKCDMDKLLAIKDSLKFYLNCGKADDKAKFEVEANKLLQKVENRMFDLNMEKEQEQVFDVDAFELDISYAIFNLRNGDFMTALGYVVKEDYLCEINQNEIVFEKLMNVVKMAVCAAEERIVEKDDVTIAWVFCTKYAQTLLNLPVDEKTCELLDLIVSKFEEIEKQ